MNKIKTIFVLLAMAVCSVACTEEQPVVEYLDVTPNNLAGTWELVEWNGAALVGESYFRIEFVRKDGKFTIWQNFDSIFNIAHKATGTYNIETDVEMGAILTGKYDYDGGLWAYKYDVNDLTSDSMTWVATDKSFTQKFVRVSDIPVK